MKKYARIAASVILAFSVVFCFSGCGGETKDNNKTTADNTVRVTFPEGSTVYEVGKLLEKNGVCSAAEFIKAVNSAGDDNEFAASIINTSERPFALEGYLFPDTYDFYKGESPQNALKRFLNNMSKKLTDVYYARAAELGFSMDEIIILASIIQTEAGDENEMKNVSSVLHNRLQSTGYLNMLQCDATYFYIRDHVMPYLRQSEAQSETESPEESTTQGDDVLYNQISELYNTYKFAGLPAGPICNPGSAAIEAALYPAETNYYYFVTDSQGNYHYSETYSAHAQKCLELGIKTA
jgi:UPF0755 protein